MSSEGNGVLKPLRKPLPIPKKFPTTFNRCCYKFYAAVDNRLWPVRPIYFVAGAATLGAIQAKFEAIPLLNVMPVFANRVAEYSKVCVISLIGAYIPVFLLRQFLSSFFFTYKRFLFEDPKRPSLATRFWGICRKLLSLSPPLLKSCDNLLPSPSVPDLDETVGKYLKSVENILRRDEFDLVKEHAHSFLKNEGRRLHMYAWIMSMMSDNYITPFWEKYAYLYSREPLLINSSVAHTDLMEIPEHRRATRAFMAARVTYFESLSQLAIDRQAIPPLGNGLLCACHYDKLYSVCRVPGEKVDELVNYGISKYVVAILNGCFYKVMICDENNRIYSINELAKIYAELFSHNDTIDGPSAMVAALTTDRRDGWARNREKFFLKHPKNAATLREIESAAFILTLDDYEYYIDPENPDKLSNFLHNMLTGNGVNRWADKSLSYVVSKNSRCGGTTEHSIGDGSEFDHIMENFVSMELLTEYPSLEDQQRIEKLTDADKNLTLATRLPVEVSDEMGMEIQRCYSQFEKLRMDVDLAASLFRKYGKGFIKKCGVSPDAFMQMAIQLANYRDQGRFVLTYEPASARFYRNSRTETLRTVTDQSCEFVYAMVNGKASNEEKIERLRVACELHSKRNREAMVGGGIDRHLFVLYVLSQGTLISSPFLDHYISQPWLLSTSHVPVVTNQIDEDKEKWRTWSGACFGAVAKDGYGICYRFGGNHSIIAHITSYKSAENTNSSRFRGQLETALQEMAALFGGAN
ncbi:hypothetical protein RB195_015325 [Necator americanus]|uniref:Choline/carnitine acyltransferase domain-containing protein n=1 Tax=Necator americanus TaxID=51031 RepID=A0ABR1E401_NECAM